MTEADIKAELARGQAEAVRMLDRWIVMAEGRSWEIRHSYGGRPGFTCEMFDSLRDRNPMLFRGDSPEAARANAAEAIRGEL